MQNSFEFKKRSVLLFMACALLLGGCVATPNYGTVFSSTETLKGNSETIPASADIVWRSAIELVAMQGFNVDQADVRGRLMVVSKEIRNQEDKDFSHTIKSTVTLVPLSEQMTRVLIAANQTTELHKKSYVWWHLLWLIPIFPIGTEYTTVVTDRDTVRSPEFYSDFFSRLAKLSADKVINVPGNVEASRQSIKPAQPVAQPQVQSAVTSSSPATGQPVAQPQSGPGEQTTTALTSQTTTTSMIPPPAESLTK